MEAATSPAASTVTADVAIIGTVVALLGLSIPFTWVHPRRRAASRWRPVRRAGGRRTTPRSEDGQAAPRARRAWPTRSQPATSRCRRLDGKHGRR